MKSRFFKLNLFLVMLIAVVLASCLIGCALKVEKTEAKTDNQYGPFVSANKTITIAQLTDTHYFPLTYSYNGNLNGTDYAKAIVVGSKPIPENHLMNIKALEQVIEEKPDYLVVSGDLTYDGEIQSHMELSNLLRYTQNQIRKTKPHFQVFVIPGNHDMYNTGAEHYRNDGSAQKVECYTTRYDVIKLYAGVGYPDLTSEEIVEHYKSIKIREGANAGNPGELFFDNLPYVGYEGCEKITKDGKDYYVINSSTDSEVLIKYQFQDATKSSFHDGDYKNGDITYVATLRDNNALVAIDEEISNEEVKHYVGGRLYIDTINFLREQKTELLGKNVFGLMHHNAIPHFKGEDAILKDFPLFGWKYDADLFVELGIHTFFTGHMHSNDIVSYETFNGEVLTDIETAAVISSMGGPRFVTIDKGTVDGKFAYNLKTKNSPLKPFSIQGLLDGGWIDQKYLDSTKLAQFTEIKSGNKYISNVNDYITHKLFYNVVENLKVNFINPEFLANAGSFVADLLKGQNIPSMLSGIMPMVSKLVDNIVYHLDRVVLADYVYPGEDEQYKSTALGAKLAGYVEQVINDIMKIQVNSQGDQLFNFGMGKYLAHVCGTDIPYSEFTEADKEGFNNIRNGKVMRDFFGILLDQERGLYRLVKGLTQPIDLERNLTDGEKSALGGVLKFVTSSKDVDLSSVVLDNYVPRALDLLKSLMGFSFSLEGKTIMEFVDHALQGYITDSFYTSTGEIVHDILFNFYHDETAHLEMSTKEPVLYKYNQELPVSYLSSAKPSAPSIENGKLPSQLTVTFGYDAKTDKNFTWITDPRLNEGYLEYTEGDFSESSASRVHANSEIYVTTTPSIDLGVYATLIHTEVAKHKVKLHNLTPGKTYSYRVGTRKNKDGATTEIYWSDVYTFKTAPENGSAFDVFLMTDIQGSALATYQQSVKVMSKLDKVFPSGYDFIVNAGDLVDNGKNNVQWEYFLNTFMPYFAKTTQVVATGNHEKSYYKKVEPNKKASYSLKPYLFANAKNDAYNYSVFRYELEGPAQDATSGRYYSFNYSDIHFTVLNTNDTAKGMSQKQIEWLKNDLQNNQSAKYRVVIMHKGPYSSGTHSFDKDVIELRKNLTPIFAEYDVRLVLQGHDHTYSESYYLDGEGQPMPKVKTGPKGKLADKGTLYITLGTMGDKYYNYVKNEEVPIEFGEKLHKPHLKNPTFGRLSYDGDSLYYVGYQYNAQKDKVQPIRATGLLWWHYVIITGICVIFVGMTAMLIVIIRKKSVGKNK